MNYLIFRRSHRDREVRVAKIDGIQDDLAFGVGLDYLEAVVGIKSRANIDT